MEEKIVFPRGTDSARVILVIETTAARGGIPIGEPCRGEPCRIVTQYWDLSGNLLAEYDPYEAAEREVSGDEN